MPAGEREIQSGQFRVSIEQLARSLSTSFNRVKFCSCWYQAPIFGELFVFSGKLFSIFGIVRELIDLDLVVLNFLEYVSLRENASFDIVTTYELFE